MTYDYKLARANYRRSKRLRRSLGWLAFGVTVAAFVAVGVALVASRPL